MSELKKSQAKTLPHSSLIFHFLLLKNWHSQNILKRKAAFASWKQILVFSRRISARRMFFNCPVAINLLIIDPIHPTVKLPPLKAQGMM